MGDLRSDRSLLAFALLAGIVLILPVQLAADHGTRGEVGGYMKGELIYNSTRSLSGGLGVGDVDDDGEVEVIFCDFEGNVVMLEASQDGSFRAGKIWQEGGEPGTDKGLFDLVIMDALSTSDGPEILVGGYSGKLYAVHKNGEDWTSTVLVRSPFRIFEIELGDIDPAVGEEVLYGSMQNDQVTPDRYLRYVRRTAGDNYEQVEVPVPEAVKAIDVADADPDVEGEEIWITTSAWNDKGGTESTLVELWNEGGTWKNRVMFTDPNNLLTNVKVGELWSGHDGNEMVITSLGGWCYLGYMEGGILKVKPIFEAKTETGSNFGLEGLAMGDINPRHPGDEALVTGYYNRVYQVVEVSGEVIADLAWEKDSEEMKLELSGVEIADVTAVHPGNEGLIASLQGWIEMLNYEQDGLSVSIPGQRFELVQGGEVRVPLRIVPSGLLRGPLVLEIETDPSINVMYPTGLNIDDHDPLDLMVVIEAKGPLSNRDIDIGVQAKVGTYTDQGTIRLSLEGSGSSLTLFTEPASGVVYTALGSHLRVRVGILGGEEYDALDLEVSDSEGLLTSVNTPIVPGEDEYMTILPIKGVSLGMRSVTVTASYAGVAVSEADFIIEVRKLSDDLDAVVTRIDDQRFIARLLYNGSVPVNHVSVEFMLGSKKVGSFDDVTLGPRSNLSIDILLDKGETGILTVFIDDLGQEEIATYNLGLIGRSSDGKSGKMDMFWVIVGVLLVLIALVFVGVALMYSRGTSDSDARIDRIGDYRGSRVNHPMNRERTIARGQMGRMPPERQAPRRAPPPPFRTQGRGPGGR
ncbi:MAG: hypothetical protein MUC62_00085 [Candidatus Thermoplasmatota archaeon]|nr:hypothetical protein [Candidatus Thermoplasmatota archaeon]